MSSQSTTLPRGAGTDQMFLANHVSKRWVAKRGEGRCHAIPKHFESMVRTNKESLSALARLGTAHPNGPSESTLEKRRCRHDNPLRKIPACINSALSSDMLTLEGHSFVHALHAKQVSSAARSSGLFKVSFGSSPLPCKT